MQTTTNTAIALFISAVLVATMHASSADAAQSGDSRRLDQLRQEVQTELRHVDQHPAANSARLRDRLEDLRDEVGYLRVIQRRGQKVEDREYRELERRLQQVRQNMRPSAAVHSRRAMRSRWALSSTFGCRIPANSNTANVEDRFEATTVIDLYQHERLLVPVGSLLRGTVSSVNRASRTDRRGSLTVTFDQMKVRGQTYDIHATVVRALEAGVKGEVGKIGAGAGVGAIVGGILGGAKGCLGWDLGGRGRWYGARHGGPGRGPSRGHRHAGAFRIPGPGRLSRPLMDEPIADLRSEADSRRGRRRC